MRTRCIRAKSAETRIDAKRNRNPLEHDEHMSRDLHHKLLTLFAKHQSLWLYIAKCCAGVVIVHVLALFTAEYINPVWCLLSILLILTPDSKEAVPLAVTRMKANVCGVIAAVAVLSFGVTNTTTLCLAFAIAIVLCHLGEVMPGCRSAICAAAVILWHEPGEHPHVWQASLSRLAAVSVGCLIGVGLTLLFHRNREKKHAEPT